MRHAFEHETRLRPTARRVFRRSAPFCGGKHAFYARTRHVACRRIDPPSIPEQKRRRRCGHIEGPCHIGESHGIHGRKAHIRVGVGHLLEQRAERMTRPASGTEEFDYHGAGRIGHQLVEIVFIEFYQTHRTPPQLRHVRREKSFSRIVGNRRRPSSETERPFGIRIGKSDKPHMESGDWIAPSPVRGHKKGNLAVPFFSRMFSRTPSTCAAERRCPGCRASWKARCGWHRTRQDAPA